MISIVTVNTELGELFGVAFEDTGYLLPNLSPSRQLAELNMVEYAQERVTAIDANYAPAEGKTRPGKRSNADKNEREAMVAIVESFEDTLRERDAIARFKATLTPEQLAVLEG